MKTKILRLLKSFIFSFVFAFGIMSYGWGERFYFEVPVAFTEKNTLFPVVINGSDKAFLFYEENKSGQLYINLKTRTAGSEDWSASKKVAGPFSFSGEVPDIYTAARLDNGILSVAVTLSEYEIGVYTSRDDGESFSFTKLSMQGQRTVAPRIFKTSSGQFVLFVSVGVENKFSIAYALSPDGRSWSGLTPFAPAWDMDNSFSPYLLPVAGGDLIVFQSHFSIPEKPKTFQLYSVFSADGLKSFSSPVLYTDDSVTASRRANSFAGYSNQMPVLYEYNGQIWCSWERNEVRSENTYISVAPVSREGKFEGRGRVKEFTDEKKSHRPLFYAFNESLNLIWFDNNNGAYSSQLTSDGYFAGEERITNSTKATFVYPVVFEEAKEIAYVWQRNDSKPQLYTVSQDHFAPSPKLTAVSFKENKRSTQESVKIRLTIPEDTNGISGYVWSFSQNPEEEPSTLDSDIIVENNMSAGRTITINASAYQDGQYYFKAKVQDVAGNWSESRTIKYYRDLTAPQKPVILPFEKDDWGFAASSVFNVSWQPFPGDDDIEGYSWSITRVAALNTQFNDSPNHPLNADGEKINGFFDSLSLREEKLLTEGNKPPRSILTKDSYKKISNLKNGIYVFSVCAIDQVGNTGESQSVLMVINKYKPFTLISGLNTKKDEFGALIINVYGQDFDYEGYIKEIYVDRDGKAPYDRTLLYSKGDFKIENSGLISGIHLEDLDVGTYGIYVRHSERGICPLNTTLKTNKFTIDQSGTIKIEHPFVLAPEWSLVADKKTRSIQIVDVLLAVLMVLCVIAAVTSIRGITVVAKESVLIQSEVTALLTGGSMPLENKMKARKLSKRQTSLKLKLIGFTALLVLAIVLMVAISLGERMIKTQRQTLVQSMEEQVNVLLEGMANSVQNAMNDALVDGNNTGLIELVRQANTFKPAKYATLIGLGNKAKDTNLDYFWASTEVTDSVSRKLDSTDPVSGKSRFNPDSTEAKIAERCKELEVQAHEQIDSILQEISEKYSKERKDEYTQILRNLSKTASGAVPEFDVDSLSADNTDYTFYYPVFYKNSGSNDLLHAVLVLQVSAKELVNELYQARIAITVISLIVAAVAIALGCVGAWILASLIVEPIKKLVKHVKVITETKDKKQLKDFAISVSSRDEIGTLGEAVNEMTAGLVKAAEDEEKAMEQEKMALDGKAVQQTFLPLLTTEKGGKRTTAELKEKDFHIFGYYEGADAVSGDYFDYKKLDDRYYAIIKCDVSGHGVPAALMMTVVATLFRKYFENWSIKTHGTQLNKLVVQINDFIESLGVKGKFATLMICLFDTKSGDVYMCNAGDNIIHVYDQESHSEKVITLHEAPAAGPLPSFMVEMKGGFIVEKTHLNPGDVLFLYTDGIEEATRFFRNENFEITKCAEPGMKDGDIHLNHKVGQESEQMEPERVKDILEAVLNHKSYKLEKYHSPVKNEELVFDFSKLNGDVDEAIMALAAVEKVFRMYKTPQAQGTVIQNEKGDVVIQGDGIRVDRKIDDFLKRTFSRYDYYAAGLVDMEEPNYVYYTGLNEDPQADDLTLLAVRKI